MDKDELDTSKVLKEHGKYFKHLMEEKEKILDKLKAVEQKLQILKEKGDIPDKREPE